ncbi:MAG TPA: DNA gyrase inhibitor YacG [Dongiaceae bacterium]|jgi:hypothetical protein|nr:DNA gyrase inhibitor YacG [Dongiaceae bacterium]
MSCPICRKPSERKWQPFCSERCRLIDLGRWLGEAYRVAGNDEEIGSTDRPSADED